jgi:hypothetical protein
MKRFREILCLGAIAICMLSCMTSNREPNEPDAVQTKVYRPTKSNVSLKYTYTKNYGYWMNGSLGYDESGTVNIVYTFKRESRDTIFGNLEIHNAGIHKIILRTSATGVRIDSIVDSSAIKLDSAVLVRAIGSELSFKSESDSSSAWGRELQIDVSTISPIYFLPLEIPVMGQKTFVFGGATRGIYVVTNECDCPTIFLEGVGMVRAHVVTDVGNGHRGEAEYILTEISGTKFDGMNVPYE